MLMLLTNHKLNAVEFFLFWILADLLILFYPEAGAASGWYLRGAIGYEKSLAADFSDTDCASTNPAALFGCATGNDGKAIGAYGDFGYCPPAVGTGFVLTEHLILDVAYRYFDLGRVETSPGNMYMDTKPAGIAINGIETRLRSHGPAAGLRYQF